MIAALTARELPALLRRSVLLGRAGHHHPRVRYRHCGLPAVGLPMAWRLARTTSRWKSALVVLMVLPLFVGSTTRTAGWMILFARGGMLDRLDRPEPDVRRTGGDRRHRRDQPAIHGSDLAERLRRHRPTAGGSRRLDGRRAVARVLARRVPAGAARHHHRRGALLHPVHERLRHACCCSAARASR